MSRVAAAIATATAVVALLGGCVGIPTGGGIVASTVFDEDTDTDFVYNVSGPQPDSEPVTLLADFLLAVRSPVNDYAVARLFLTPELAETWNPDASVLIRGTTTSIEPGGQPDSLRYLFTSKASVDAQGRYTEQRDAVTQSHTFVFARSGDDQQWRIAAAPDGIVLSASSFANTFGEHSLYYFDPSHRYLVPDVRFFPARPTTPSRVVAELLAGPNEMLQQGVVVSEFPEPTALGVGSVRISSGVATVDLSDNAAATDQQQREWMRQQLAATLGTPEVVITVSGVPLTLPDTTGGAVINPTVESAALIATADSFGFATAAAVTAIPELSETVLALEPSGATLAEDGRAVAVRAGDGTVQLVSELGAVVLDERDGLVTPSIDPFGLVWSAPAGDPAAIIAFEASGAPHPVAVAGMPPNSRLVSLDLARDGARVLLAVNTDLGPQLYAAGVIRRDGIPAQLGPFLPLPVSAGTILDADWVDNHTVVALVAGETSTKVAAFSLGGPSMSLGELDGAVTVVGGNGGRSGIRVLTGTGSVQQPSGTNGWAPTGIEALLLATQQ